MHDDIGNDQTRPPPTSGTSSTDQAGELFRILPVPHCVVFAVNRPGVAFKTQQLFDVDREPVRNAALAYVPRKIGISFKQKVEGVSKEYRGELIVHRGSIARRATVTRDRRGGFPEWRKMSRDVREALRSSEDYLSGRTLGLFRFLSTATLVDLLRSMNVDLGGDRPQITLWPDAGSCEPDALIESLHASVLIEAKFLGSRLGFYPSQLGREWTVLRERGAATKHLLLVTNDASEPPVPSLKLTNGQLTCASPEVSIAEQIHQYCVLMHLDVPSVASIEATVRWHSWSMLAHQCERLIERCEENTPDSSVLGDICAVLHTFGCKPFSGWTFDLPTIQGGPQSKVWCGTGRAGRVLWTFSHDPLPSSVVPPWGLA